MFCNIAAYKFIALNPEDLDDICTHLRNRAAEYSLRGTILLSTEGINLFLAGEKLSIGAFQQHLASYYSFSDLEYKYSYSNYIPFKKLVVKIKNEIVTFKQELIQPEKFAAPYILPKDLKASLDSKQEMILLDTRNAFEYKTGSFTSAIHLGINHFRDFPDAIRKEQQISKDQPIITFCTGGIRCEKAATYLLLQGFKEVYQLKGGILHYFEHCGSDYFKGNCFVFDDRLALNSQLEPV